MSSLFTSRIILLPQNGNSTDLKIELFTLPHPSNNESKTSLKLFTQNDKLYQIRNHQFSKSCQFKETENLANDQYHYTHDGSPLKSIFLVNEDDPSDGEIISNSALQISLFYDLAFSLIGVFYKDSKSASEEEYVKGKIDEGKTGKLDDRFLTVRDYHDLLVDSHDPNWNMIPLSLLEDRLTPISELTEEAGDKYFKITEDAIVNHLLNKVEKIVENFPKSLPIPMDYPEDIQNCLKYIMACNLLISMIPIHAYKKLVKSSKIEEYTQKYKKYREENDSVIKERKLLTENAMSVGIQTNESFEKKRKVTKKTVVVKPKVSVGKGAIDGFFKRQKK